ncbi:MAG: MerR family transcriptional regulator [Bacillota bacterium]|nr:MerR family transcriptional regulator [Bacillota bacterium]
MRIMLRNCQRCGQVYAGGHALLCPSCVAAAEEEYERVQDYLREHPRAHIHDISQATGVPTATVISFLRDGRLLAEDPQLTCERCGKPIVSGRYCPSCREELLEAVERAAVVPYTRFYGTVRRRHKYYQER